MKKRLLNNYKSSGTKGAYECLAIKFYVAAEVVVCLNSSCFQTGDTLYIYIYISIDAVFNKIESSGNYIPWFIQL